MESREAPGRRVTPQYTAVVLRAETLVKTAQQQHVYVSRKEVWGAVILIGEGVPGRPNGAWCLIGEVNAIP